MKNTSSTFGAKGASTCLSLALLIWAQGMSNRVAQATGYMATQGFRLSSSNIGQIASSTALICSVVAWAIASQNCLDIASLMSRSAIGHPSHRFT